MVADIHNGADADLVGRSDLGALLDTETSMKPDSKSAMALILVVGAIVRLVDLGYQSYSMDELWELTIVHLPVGEIAGVGDGFPPLFHLIFRGLIVGGVGDIAGRILSAVLGIATIWVVGRLGQRVSSTVGIASAFAVAIAPLLVLLSKEGRAYGLFILLAALLLLTTWNVIDSNSTRSWALFGIVGALGMYSHYMFALALASAEVIILWNLRRGLSIHRWITTHAVAATFLIPLAFIAVADFELDASNSYSPTVDVPAIAYAGLSLFTGFTLGPSTRALHTMAAGDAIFSALPWIVLIGVPAGYLLHHGWRGMTSGWRMRLAVPLLVPTALLSLFSVAVGVAFRVRYLSWLVIPLSIWLAIGYSRAKGVARHVAAGTLIVIAAIAMVTRVTVSDYQVEDARRAAEYVSENPDTPVVAMAWYMARPVEYYIDPDVATYLSPDQGRGRFNYHELLDNRVVPIPSPRSSDPTFSEQLAIFDAAVAIGEEYLFVYSREFHGDPDGEFLSIRESADGLVPAAEFAGITIYRGTRGGTR